MGKQLQGFVKGLSISMLSRNFNLILLGLVLVTMALDEMLKGVGLQADFVRGWWFSTCLGILVLNSFVCSLRRVRRQITDYNIHYIIDGNKGDYEQLKSRFRHLGFRETGSGKDFWYGEKNRIGRWGSVVFHSSLGVIGLGILMNSLFGMSGGMAIPVGYPVYEQHSSYLGRVEEGKLFKEKHAGFKLTLNSLTPEYAYGNKTFSSLEGHMTLEDGGYVVVSSPIGPNRGLTHRGRKIMLGNFGVAPLISVHFDNKERLRSLVTLAKGGGGGGDSLYFADSITIPQTPVVASIRVFPEAVTIEGEKVRARSLLLKNPVMDLELREEEFLLKKGYLKPGESLVLENGLRVCFEDVRYYGFFTVSYLPGLWVLYMGLIGIVLGLGLTVFFDHQVIRLSSRGGDLDVQGRAAHYTSSFNSFLEENLGEVFRGGNLADNVKL